MNIHVNRNFQKIWEREIMKDYEQKNEEEMLYLDNTLNFIKKELEREQYDLNDRGQNLIDSRRWF